MLQFAEGAIKLGRLILRVNILLLLSLMLMTPFGMASAASGKKSAQPSAPQKTFSSPEEASQALASAAKANDIEQLLALLGPEGRQLLFSGDEVQDKERLEHFANLYEEKNQVVKQNDAVAFLEVGKGSWPLPIPIVKKSQWQFDTRAGKQEILNRRIGKNELSTIQVCLAYVDAQREYASKDRDSDGILEYAQQFASDPDNKNGLFWEAAAGEEPSPLGPLVANARAEGYRKKKSAAEAEPYHGYYFKILKAQSANAPRGAYDYVIDGKMISGFAMVAYPAEYGNSGVMTFIVSHDGIVYERDLGKKTPFIVQKMTMFDPDGNWEKVEAKYLELPDKGI